FDNAKGPPPVLRLNSFNQMRDQHEDDAGNEAEQYSCADPLWLGFCHARDCSPTGRGRKSGLATAIRHFRDDAKRLRPRWRSRDGGQRLPQGSGRETRRTTVFKVSAASGIVIMGNPVASRESFKLPPCPFLGRPAARPSPIDSPFPSFSRSSACLIRPMSFAIRCRQLVKRYDGKPPVEAVRGLDLDVRSGECFGLLGPNGAGKTTTMEILE